MSDRKATHGSGAPETAGAGEGTGQGPGDEILQSQVEVDLTLCKACGICSALCPENVFDVDKQRLPVVARPDDCTSCLICELHCPDFAIEVRRRAKKRPAQRAAEGAPALSQDDLIAATIAAGESEAACNHHDEEG